MLVYCPIPICLTTCVHLYICYITCIYVSIVTGTYILCILAACSAMHGWCMCEMRTFDNSAHRRQRERGGGKEAIFAQHVWVWIFGGIHTHTHTRRKHAVKYLYIEISSAVSAAEQHSNSEQKVLHVDFYIFFLFFRFFLHLFFLWMFCCSLLLLIKPQFMRSHYWMWSWIGWPACTTFMCSSSMRVWENIYLLPIL